MKAIVVDDEQAARSLICQILARRNDVEVIGEAGNGIEGIEKINSLKPDLLFLDVQMPVLSGFDILPYLEEKPLIIFCTAHEEYAMRAFEANAVDYLLKPVEEKQLNQCFEKLRGQSQRLADLDWGSKTGLQKIVCRNQRTRQVVWLDDVASFHKEGRYTKAALFDKFTHLTELTLDYLHAHLPPQQFCRISRSVIVSRGEACTLNTQASGTGELECKTGQKLAVSRGRLAAFKLWLES